MRIYHYTNLESLALILKNQTIRFNRLDKVDDLEEGNTESLGVYSVNMFLCHAGPKQQKKAFPCGKCMAAIAGE